MMQPAACSCCIAERLRSPDVAGLAWQATKCLEKNDVRQLLIIPHHLFLVDLAARSLQCIRPQQSVRNTFFGRRARSLF